MPRDCCAFKASAREHGCFEGPVGDDFPHNCKGWAVQPTMDVSIGIGHERTLFIDKEQQLHVVNNRDKACVRLFDGRITKQRIDFLIECLQRLRTYAD